MSLRIDNSDDGAKRRRVATLRDVAAAAKVDVSTVSKVLSGGDISVRSETRERIERAARDLRYRPNATARSLRLLRTGALGMLIPDFTNPAYAPIVRGAVRRAEKSGYVMLIAEHRGSSTVAYRRLVHERRIDGLLVTTARETDALAEEFERDGIPHVFVNRRASKHSRSVIVDDEGAAAMGTQLLIDAGHRKLAIIAGPRDVDTAVRRRIGFDRACAAAGVRRTRSASAEYTASGGYKAMERLLAGGTRPTGVFVSNLTSALGALSAASHAGVRVPEDLSMVCYEDSELAEVSQPPLTAVAVPLDEMGEAAVDVLAATLAGEDVPGLIVPTRPVLVERASVAPPAA